MPAYQYLNEVNVDNNKTAFMVAIESNKIIYILYTLSHKHFIYILYD